MRKQQPKLPTEDPRRYLKGVIKVIHDFYPDIYSAFSDVIKDPRDLRYVTYPLYVILSCILFKNILSFSSMHSFQMAYDNANFINNILHSIGVETITRLPVAKTINDCLSLLPTVFLQDLLYRIVYAGIRSKRLDAYRFRAGGQHYWIIAVDATQLYQGSRKINNQCLFRIHKKGTAEEYTEYYISVLCAHIVLLGTSLSLPFFFVMIENSAEDEKRQQNMGAEKIKQDCELKAFKRFAERLKKKCPRLPVCLLMDALYVSKPVMDIAKNNGWALIIRYKEGAYREIQEIVDGLKKHASQVTLPNQIGIENIFYFNDLELEGGRYINYLECTFNKDKMEKPSKSNKGRKASRTTPEKEVQFQWVSTIPFETQMVLRFINTARSRWNIEETFNRYKHWTNDITHMCSWNTNAIKNHFAMILIAEYFVTLYELFTFVVMNKAYCVKSMAEKYRDGIKAPTWIELQDVVFSQWESMAKYRRPKRQAVG